MLASTSSRSAKPVTAGPAYKRPQRSMRAVSVQVDVSAKQSSAPSAPIQAAPIQAARHVRLANNVLSFVSYFRKPARPSPHPSVTTLVDPFPSTSTSPASIRPLEVAAPHPTLTLIENRRRQGSMPGKRKDGFKVGLVVEGGGMRGVISGAMLMALQMLGLQNAFDVVYGASAGAINSTFFLSGQRHGLDIYAEDLTQGTKFLDFMQLIKGRPVMSLDYLIDDVMHNAKPLDWDAVLNHPVPLKIVASSLDTLQPVLLSDFTSKEDLMECLKASATIPKFAGPPRVVRGQRLVDAAVFEPVPIQSAIADGCTHLLVLCTRPSPTALPSKGWSKEVGKVTSRFIRQTVINADYMRDAWLSDLSGPCQDELLASTLGMSPTEVQQQLGAYVLPIYPATAAGCHPACLHPETLKRGIAEGARSVERMFGRALDAEAEVPALAGTMSTIELAVN